MLKVKEYVFWLSSWLEAQTRFAFCKDNTAGCVTLIDTTGAKVTTCPILVLTQAENVETILVEGGFLNTEPDV